MRRQGCLCMYWNMLGFQCLQLEENLLITTDAESSSDIWGKYAWGNTWVLLCDSRQPSMQTQYLQVALYSMKGKFYWVRITVLLPGKKSCRAAGRSLFKQTDEPRRGVPSLQPAGGSQTRSGVMLSQVPFCQSFLSLSTHGSLSMHSALDWVMRVFMYNKCWVSVELIETLPNCVLFPLG